MTQFCTSIGTIILISFLCLGTFVNGNVASNGRVPILKDNLGYYVAVDYSQDPATSKVGKFTFSLFNSKTIIGSSNCLGYTDRGCSNGNCKSFSSEKTDIVDPSFTAKARKANVEAHLDHKFWSLKENAYVIEQYSCSSPVGDWVGGGRDGILGLSKDNLGDKNFLEPACRSYAFTVDMKEDLSGGNLTFRCDSITGGFFDLPLVQDSLWITPTMPCGLQFPNSAAKTVSARIMFDPFSDIITFPPDLHNFMISTLSQYGANCKTDKTRPTCTFNNYISKLPTLKFTFKYQERTTFHDFPPSLYLKDGKTDYQSTITLNIKAADPSYTGVNYIHPNFKNSVIFHDRYLALNIVQFREKEMRVFLKSGGSRTLEKDPEPEPEPKPEPKPETKSEPSTTSGSNMSKLLMPIAGIFVVLATIGICIKIRQKKAASALAQDLARGSFSEDPSSPPLNFAQQQTSAPQQNYAQQQHFAYQQNSHPHQNYAQPQTYNPQYTSAPQQNFNPQQYYPPQSQQQTAPK